MTDPTVPPVRLDPDVARALAADLKRITGAVLSVVDGDRPGARLLASVTGHLGRSPRDVVSVTADFRPWEHASVQVGVNAYLAGHDTAGGWFGVRGARRDPFTTLLGLLASADRDGGAVLGEPEYTTTATGPDTTTEAIQFGLVPTRSPGGAPVLIGIRGPEPHMGPTQACRLDVLAARREIAAETHEELEKLIAAHDVLRGQVIAFGTSEFRGNELVTFLPRPALTERQVVLPDGLLAGIEEHVIGVAEHAEELLAAGQHLKRGLLLYGPPGTGKTHTLRYLMSRLPDTTVVVLTGAGMRFISQAAALARRFQPSMVVLEDVDLVANDRSISAGPNPLLFGLLDAMDGIGADADVTFVLTTNRAELLERALADRPGRVDLAVEIPRPDATGRERLLRLYSDGVALTASLDPVIAATEGVTASFLKELVRRAVLVALRAGTTTVTDAALGTALDAMTTSRNTLTRSLLGAPTPPDT